MINKDIPSDMIKGYSGVAMRLRERGETFPEGGNGGIAPRFSLKDKFFRDIRRIDAMDVEYWKNAMGGGELDAERQAGLREWQWKNHAEFMVEAFGGARCRELYAGDYEEYILKGKRVDLRGRD